MSASWNGWSVQGANLVRGPQSIPLSYLVTANHLVGYVESFARNGADDATIAGLVRAFVELRKT
jgi:hypothetical protein